MSQDLVGSSYNRMYRKMFKLLISLLENVYVLKCSEIYSPAREENEM